MFVAEGAGWGWSILDRGLLGLWDRALAAACVDWDEGLGVWGSERRLGLECTGVGVGGREESTVVLPLPFDPRMSVSGGLNPMTCASPPIRIADERGGAAARRPVGTRRGAEVCRKSLWDPDHWNYLHGGRGAGGGERACWSVSEGP